MWDSFSRHKVSDELRKAPLLAESPSRSSSAHGYDILADFEKDTCSQQRIKLRRRASGLFISMLTVLVVVETILLARTFYVLPEGPVPQCKATMA